MTTTQDQSIGIEILHQISWGVKASLGFSKPVTVHNGVSFSARILPMRKDGTRGTRPRIMDVTIVLNGMDYYDITVTCGDTTHVAINDVDCFSLNRALLSIDYDGTDVLNPRYS